ncbi:MAG: hypothetical protein M3434_10530 [Gemmatimonadota bacterium]|nr:hypothetical protein [Gemmatimonadota bacterium]
MAVWKCPQCGFPDNPQDSRRCDSCGFVRAGKLVLVSAETEGRLTVGVDTAIGRRLLQGFAGADHIYAGEPQFLLSRDLGEGGWKITAAPAATNATFLNGADLAGKSAPLEHAATVSIGPSKMQLRVEIVD